MDHLVIIDCSKPINEFCEKMSIEAQNMQHKRNESSVVKTIFFRVEMRRNEQDANPSYEPFRKVYIV
jgi:hypothetical protein